MRLKDMPVGSKLREERSGLELLVAEHGHMEYEGTTLLTDRVVEIAALDAAEPENTHADFREKGFPFYPVSNLHRWLNSAEADWYAPAHGADAPPTAENITQGPREFYDAPFHAPGCRFDGDFSKAGSPGFLARFSEDFRRALIEAEIPCAEPVREILCPHSPTFPVYCPAKVFLPSANELGYEDFSLYMEGYRFALFEDARMRAAAPVPALTGGGADYRGCAMFYWLRSPGGLPGTALIYVGDHRNNDGNAYPVWAAAARTVSGVRPAMNVDPELRVSAPDAFGVRALLFGGEDG